VGRRRTNDQHFYLQFHCILDPNAGMVGPCNGWVWQRRAKRFSRGHYLGLGDRDAAKCGGGLRRGGTAGMPLSRCGVRRNQSRHGLGNYGGMVREKFDWKQNNRHCCTVGLLGDRFPGPSQRGSRFGTWHRPGVFLVAGAALAPAVAVAATELLCLWPPRKFENSLWPLERSRR